MSASYLIPSKLILTIRRIAQGVDPVDRPLWGGGELKRKGKDESSIGAVYFEKKDDL